jgi:hypothetical protein
VLKPSQTYKLNVFNSGAAGKHIYILNLDADYCVRLLVPPRFGQDEPLIGLMRTKLLKGPATPGREVFLIVATNAPVSLEALEQPCMDADGARSGTVKVYDDPLAQLLRNAGASRRGPTPDLQLDGWSTSFLTLVTEP